MKKSLKEKLNKIKSKINQIKYYNKNYQKILERREYLDKKEIERKNIEQKLYENSIEFEDERF